MNAPAKRIKRFINIFGRWYRSNVRWYTNFELFAQFGYFEGSIDSMNFLSHRVSKILIHILFWALFVFISLFVFPEYHWKENPFLQYFFILLVIVYSNDQVFLPFFIQRKMYVLYVLLIGGIAFLATQLYCNYFAECGCSILKCLSDYLWQTLVPLVFFSFIWMLFRFLEKQEEIEAIQKEHTEMELRFLKSQINPHVLFNNLNTIYSYALEKPDAVPDMILMLSDNLKHVLYESNSHTVALEKELEYIDNYIAFQKIRAEKITHIDYRSKIDVKAYKIAPLLLITLIENAFKHSAPKSTIKINITVKDSVLECYCENKVKTENAESKEIRVGLQNLTKRLSLLYKNKHELKITEAENYEVYLKLNLA